MLLYIFIIHNENLFFLTYSLQIPYVQNSLCVSNLPINSHQEKRELSEYKTIYIIKDYFLLIYESLQKDTKELTKILFRLFDLLQKNGRKSHRYEKKPSLIS